MPITYGELRLLHENTYRALAMNPDNAKEPAKNPDLDTGLYSKYVKFQVHHKGRLEYLNTGGQFELPASTDGDKCMPPLLFKYSSPRKQTLKPQPNGNYRKDHPSCAFPPLRIAAYEKANTNFRAGMSKAGQSSIPMLRDLLVMDIAYLHLRNVKWLPKEAAHLAGGSSRSDDDDPPPPAEGAELDFLKWDSTDLNSVPWKKLSFSLTGSDKMKSGDVPMYMLPALLLATHAICSQLDDTPDGLQDYYDKCKQQIGDDSGEDISSFVDLVPPEAESERPRVPPSDNWQRSLRPRAYTGPELEYIALIWKMTLEASDAAASKKSKEMHAGAGDEIVKPTSEDAEEPAVDEGGEGGAAGATSGAESEANDIRELRPRVPKESAAGPAAAASGPASGPSRTGGRRKQKAKFVRTDNTPALPLPMVTSDSRAAKRGRKRANHASSNPSIPLSSTTGRILPGQVSLNQRFPKSYASPDAPKTSPVKNLTLGQAWHVVSSIF